ncbi:MAG: class I SAM-dependent DNA methyltransferase, partial [Acidobacteriota bacterium]|nr:class I SAM-dependent DNA methyltransferase [Acidobacteriota bacterium]
MPVTLLEFVRKWNASLLTERSSSQQHFRDLCEALRVPHPTEIDEIGTAYCFDKRVTKLSGGEGFADVWKRGFFAWEYKSKGGDLKAAYRQLSNYHEALENPPLLVVCDFVRFEVHTKFENSPTRVYAFTLDDLLLNRDTPTCAIPPVEVLRACFTDFNPLRPENTAVRVTRAAAADLLRLAERLELERRPTPLSREQIAHFLMRIVFCLFADSIGLLPEHTFRDLALSKDRFLPTKFRRKLRLLFQAMSEEDGIFGAHSIRYFNGGLFDSDAVIELDLADLGILASAASHDWAHIEPTIFGTLFERSLDASKRSLIGAHYTSTEDILLLIEPVVMQPLQRRWAAVRTEAEAALAEERPPSALHHPSAPSEPISNPGTPSAPTVSSSAKVVSTLRLASQPRLQLDRPSFKILSAWVEELNQITILDPACGSGNFLYVALRRLLDLWYEAQRFATINGLSLVLDPMPNPQQLFGIETDFYAHEIASVVVWIGFLQWKHEHGIQSDKEPLLQKLSNIQHADAILRYDAEDKPFEPEWPAANFIIGNPPFLGDKKMRAELNIEPHPRYVDDLRTLYESRVPGGADLVTYWFEKARAIIERQPARAGLLATNSIRMVGNRPVLERILKSGNIFMAWSDRAWSLDGAAVRVSMIGFDNNDEPQHTLDGEPVQQIHADLTGESNVASALRLKENEGLCFLGIMKGGPFDITDEEARKMLSRPTNPNGKPNSDVIKRRLGGQDITGRDRGGWLIDFRDMPQAEASLYEWPFEYVKKHVKPLRSVNRDILMHKNWWLHGRTRPALRRAIANLSRCIVTPEVAKHRLFIWMDTAVVPDHTCHVIAREDDYCFGLLHSLPHQIWSLSLGSTLEDRPRYSSDITFATFPFPWPPNHEPKDSPPVEAIAAAARDLVQLRDAWLNPPDTPEADLKKRTLTNLYNQRPTWLDDAHRT